MLLSWQHMARRSALGLCLIFLRVTGLHAGWSFDTGLAPEEARDLLATNAVPSAPTESWLRLHDMERSAVLAKDGLESAPWSGVNPAHTVAVRRVALQQLRTKGYRFVALIQWPSESWAGGVRTDSPIRRTPYDLREAFARCQALAITYGDLIDYWEIGNEPDISFVEENPETYTAFLKACSLGIRAGLKERDPEASMRGAVLMAPLALPPGPYFSAFVLNNGMQYTYGFNYHYYGYAEDFTGVYQQFHDAVSQALSLKQDAVLSTNFYPNNQGWTAKDVIGFGHTQEATQANRAILMARPLADGEPALEPQGRWLVSRGVTVTETSEGWRFEITSMAPGPQRPAMAELPLPENWKPGMDSLLSFQHRVVRMRGATVDASRVTTSETPKAEGDISDHSSPRATAFTNQKIYYSEANPFSSSRSNSGVRELPVFITEYGYGLLSKEARATPEGRRHQDAWFRRVHPQVRALGIGGAMAFILEPYLEADSSEFGLLMDTDLDLKGTRISPLNSDSMVLIPAAGSKFGNRVVSPALGALFRDGQTPIATQSWSIRAPAAPTAVVLDFVAGSGLLQAKSYGGYLLTGDHGRGTSVAEGRLVVYNFQNKITSGELSLNGSEWAFMDGSKKLDQTLSAGERRELPVQIAAIQHIFSPQSAQAVFRVTDIASVMSIGPLAQVVGPLVLPTKQKAETLPVFASTPLQAQFDVYIRTANGNLYQTWPRPIATETWQSYTERMGNLTMAFFGRAHLPWSFEDNSPVALVYFFRPCNLPLAFEIRRPSVYEFSGRP